MYVTFQRVVASTFYRPTISRSSRSNYRLIFNRRSHSLLLSSISGREFFSPRRKTGFLSFYRSDSWSNSEEKKGEKKTGRSQCLLCPVRSRFRVETSPFPRSSTVAMVRFIGQLLQDCTSTSARRYIPTAGNRYGRFYACPVCLVVPDRREPCPCSQPLREI